MIEPQKFEAGVEGVYRGENPNPRDPNRAQHAAADPRASIWVSASAGSGKTKVLADRVIRLLLDGAQPEKILCLTFTRAAAAEMAVRLTRLLAKWATCEDAVLYADLDALFAPARPEGRQIEAARRLFAETLATPGGMRIGTIHAFAQEILRRFPLEAGVQPHFTAMEEAEAAALRADARAGLLIEASQKPRSAEGRALRRLNERLGAESFVEALEKMAAQPERLLHAIAEAGGRKELIASLYRRLMLEPDDAPENLLKDFAKEKNFPAAKVREAARIVAEKGTAKYTSGAQAMLAWLASKDTARIAGFESYRKAFLTDKSEIRADLMNKPLAKEYPEADALLRDEAARVLGMAERLDSLRIAEETAALLILADAYLKRLEKEKASRALLDFDDLIRKTTALLERPGIADWVLYKLDGGLDHILLDEAQDTNPHQWRIVKALAGAFFDGIGSRSDAIRTLFVVGDEKQSIYSFQNADPELFRIMRAHFETRIVAAEKKYREVEMNVSFRSAPAILKAVDAVFADDAARAGVSEKQVAHFSFHEDAQGHVEIWPLIPPPVKDKSEENWVVPDAYEIEEKPAAFLAAKIAAQIKSWMADGLPVFDRDLGARRAFRPSDAMILVPTRKRGSFVAHLVRALKQKNVPVMGIDRMVLANEIVVMDCAALLAFMLLPEDDLNLAALLRGPLIGATEEQLMTLAIGRKGSLWQSLNKAAETDPAFRAMCFYLREALDAADLATPYATLSRFLNTPCPADAISGRRALITRLGHEAADPLDELLDAALLFGSRATPSLQAFLHWLTASEVEIKREMSQDAGEVRIMTVHAAKGLEAPIVILPDTTKPPEAQKIDKILWDLPKGGEDKTPAPFFVSKEPQNGFLKALRASALEKQTEEYRRLLYVAMTRAGERLYVAGWGVEEEKLKPGSWYALMQKVLKPLCVGGIEGFGEEKEMPLDQKLRTEEQGREKKAARCGSRLPAWARQAAPDEPLPPRPLTPSRPDEDEPAFLSPNAPSFARGRIIHALLQNLPDMEEARRREAAARYLANPQQGLTAKDQALILDEVLGLLADLRFAPLFGPASRAEVPILGLVEGRAIAGQVDRLCVLEDEVWIVDYKTNRPPPTDARFVPPVYRRQLAAYRAVLERIYPAKRIRSFLLWTHTALLMEA